MVQGLRHIAPSAPTLVRLLARLAHVDVAESGQSLSGQLSQWLGWTDAIALSTALNANSYGIASDTQAVDNDAAKHSILVRTSLTRLIDSTCGFAATAHRATAHAALRQTASDTVHDYADLRQRYISVQQAMETDIADLRARLRIMLASHAPDMARLSTVDAAMEQALAARERNLLAGIPALLGVHFKRLRDAADATPTDAPAGTAAAAGTSEPWLDIFRKAMRSVLLAELDARFQPVEGLLSAFCTRPPKCYDPILP